MKRKVENLSDQCQGRSRQECKLTLDNIDTEATELVRSAEKSCRKLRAGAVTFSPQLSKLGLA